MRKVIQNTDLVLIPVTSVDTSIYFPKDRIFANKKIKRMYVINSDFSTIDPQGTPIVPTSYLDYVYLDIVSPGDKKIMQNMSAVYLVPGINFDFQINDELNFLMTEIKIIPNNLLNPGRTYSLPIVIEYETTMLLPFVEPANSIGVYIPLGDSTVIRLSSYINHYLNNKTIQRITAEGNTKGASLTLRERSGKVINQIPAKMFDPYLETENIYLDSWNIDFENSFIETSQTGYIYLTLYYYE